MLQLPPCIPIITICLKNQYATCSQRLQIQPTFYISRLQIEPTALFFFSIYLPFSFHHHSLLFPFPFTCSLHRVVCIPFLIHTNPNPLPLLPTRSNFLLTFQYIKLCSKRLQEAESYKLGRVKNHLGKLGLVRQDNRGKRHIPKEISWPSLSRAGLQSLTEELWCIITPRQKHAKNIKKEQDW